MYFDCTTQQRAGTTVVTPSGDVDRDTAGQLQQALEAAIDTPGTTLVDVDLAGVGFMDSSGIGALLSAHRHAQGTGVRLQIRDALPPVRTVLDITNVWRMLSA